MNQIFLIIVAILTMTGFRVLLTERWNIRESSPTLWIKVCDEMINAEIKENDLDGGDALSGQQLTVRNAVESIIDDINDVDHAWIRVAMYPDDPSNPPAPEAGDTAFTLSRALTRTIEVCENSSSNPFKGGEARPETEESKIIGCEIELNRRTRKTGKQFISTLTHEIGHCLGLNHPQETRNAIMSYFHSDDDYRLLIDDKMGLIHLFPEDGLDLKEKASFGLSCSKKD